MLIRHYFMRLILFLSIGLLISACQSEGARKDNEKTPSTSELSSPSIDLEYTSVTAAKGFLSRPIEGGGKAIALFNGPDTLAFFARPGKLKDSTIIQTVDGGKWLIDRIAISSTTFVPYLKALGVDDWIVASSWADHILDDDLKARVENGTIIDLTKGEVLDMERLAASGADILFYDPAEGDLASQASRIGVLAIPVQEYMEVHPLARADWLRFFGAVLGREAQAEEVIDDIRSRYRELKVLASRSVGRPKVLMGSIYQGKWYAPPTNSLAGQWIRDAGGSYILEGRESGGNITLDMEELLSIGSEIDWFGHMGFGPFEQEKLVEKDARLSQIRAIDNGQIFYCDTRTVDYFGQAILEPDKILGDIIAILHPEVEVQGSGVYFEKVGE